jgi:DNA-binding MarR family transcriptional regulator
MSSAAPNRLPGIEQAPYIGALLRMALQTARGRIVQALSEKGLDDINQAYAPLFQYPPIDGMRPSDLAKRLGISKQALNHVLGQVEKLGYIERRVAQDSRGAAVHFTDRGWQVLETTVATMRQLEADWQAQIGKRRFAELKAALRELTGNS